jgi:hypothetical protein
VSYPDLGCFAECLTCEVCEDGLGLNPPPDLFPDEWPDSDSDPYGLLDWEPPADDDKPGLDFDLPTDNDLYVVPMNPFDGTFGGSFGGSF